MRPNTGQARFVRSLGIGVIAALVVSGANAADWFVDADAPGTGQTGNDWVHPCTTIQAAHAAASNGDGIVNLYDLLAVISAIGQCP